MGKKTPPYPHYPKWTTSRFWTFIRSGLRNTSTRWPPLQEALLLARRASKSDNKRLKWEFKCTECKKWFQRTAVVVDHILPADTLKSFDDLPEFCERLFCPVEGFQ